MTKTSITFNRTILGMTNGILTVAEYRRHAWFAFRSTSWKTAARKMAAQLGEVLVLRGDGSMVHFVGEEDGTVNETIYGAGYWAWV